MAGDPAELRLAEPIALIDAARTGLDPDEQLARLDHLAADCTDDSFDAVHRHLFEEEGFTGDPDHYHHERNSLLSTVLDRRRGLPILLSVVAIDVAAQRHVTLHPIGMPGHFLVRHDGATRVYVDPFDAGSLLDVEGCAALFRRSNGPSPPFLPSLLDPVEPLAVIARVLANLRGTYAAGGDLANLRWVLELRSEIPGIPVVEAFERAAVLDELGRHDDAAEVLDALADDPDERVVTAAGHRARALRARNN